MKNRLKILSGLRLRHLLVSFIFLIIILIAAGYFSIHAGQEATLDSLVEQGKALTTVLTASASNIIETDRQIKDISIDKLLGEINNFRQSHSGDVDLRYLRILSGRFRLTRAYLLDDTLGIIYEQASESRGMTEELDSLYTHFLESIEPDSSYDIVFDFYPVGERWFLYALLPFGDSTSLLIVSPWLAGQYGDQRLSLAYLLNQLSQEAGIEYIMLQNNDGIVFASKQISQMNRIQDDPFLLAAMDADTACSRIINFQDREILEVVQKFNSGEEFYGLLRVGLSLYAYRQLTANFKRQVWLFVIILVVLGIIGVVIVFGYQNISITEDALNRAKAITQSLQDSIAGIVISTDENLKIVTANVEARRQFGLPESDIGWQYDKYFPDDPFKVKAVLRDRRPLSFETRIEGKAGVMQMLVSTSALHSGADKATGVIVVAHDISEKRALERQAQQSHRLSELGTVAAGLAHDIRNPLNAIGMVMQRLGNEVEVQGDRTEFDEFLRTLKTEHTKLNAIIEKILTVARSSRLDLKQTEIRPVIEEAIALYRYEAADHEITIDATITDGSLLLNEGMFKNIISNLIKNAIEAIGNKGKIAVGAVFDSGNLIVKVTDDGPGIAADQIPNLFRTFYTTKPGGTGLGLATAYKAATDHGGDLRVDSKPGGPTTFILTIPIKR
jgi:two-component system sensor histidine kinase HydH